MAPVLVATVGSATANSYVTVAEGDTYFDERLNVSAWTDAAADDKARALIMATRRIDMEEFEGEKAASGQALQWPRIGAIDPDGYEYDSAAIPQIVQDATCELALKFLNDGTTDAFASSSLAQFENVQVDTIDVTPRSSFDPTDLPDTVRRLLKPVLTTSESSIPVIRG